MAVVQVRNPELREILRADFQGRYEPNFAWKSACSANLALPALRAFWPMSAVDYTNPQCKDIAGGGYHLTNNNTATFGYSPGLLVPCVYLNGANQYLSRADGGVGNWADVTGTEAYVENTAVAARGLTLGGWFRIDTFPGVGLYEYLIGKWGAAPNLSYLLCLYDTDDVLFIVRNAGLGVNIIAQYSGLSANTWYQFVGRFVPSISASVFVNAAETAQAVNVPASVPDSTANFVIGADSPGTGYFFDGRASLCFLCAAAHSDAIIRSLYQQTRAAFGV